MTDYPRTIEDELDWSVVNQLHAVVLQIGTFCFRTKQVCLTVLIGVIGFITALTSDELDTSIFVAGLLIPICFWFLDSVAYFYQVKLRGVMDGVRDRIQKRHSTELLRGQNSEVISNERISRSSTKKVGDAFFNHSMWIYYILIITDLVLWLAFSKGAIN
ncbi:hypothetical protein [Marinobacter salsuginis]|uniref:hypothetical protein n=1 Tax=Marinobacter salsuginis TaxID=418719 RepID=UPI001AE04C88|nr:hypothetical protein [Marinobacter salsuginis]QTN43330.1 hypothetical protein HZ997_08340 [Marinobacter salsuginis]